MKFSARLLLMLALTAGCPRQAPPVPPQQAEDGGPHDPEFDRLAQRLLDEHNAVRPTSAVEMGQHAYDGKLRDVSRAGLEREIAGLQEAIAALDAVDRSGLDRMQRVEHTTLRVALGGERFDLVTLRRPWRNPMTYMGGLNLVPYISRDYAPLEQRTKALIAVARGAAKHLAHADENLEAALPRTFLETGLLQVRGTIDFCKTDVPAALEGISGEPRAELDAALAEMTAALEGYAAALERRRPQVTEDFALGPEGFVAMLEQSQGIEIDLPRLRELAQQDLERNLVALEQAAAQIDPKRPLAEVVAQVLSEKPATDAVLKTATEQVATMRKVIVERDLVTIPSDDSVSVQPTPPFMRWNSAFLDPAGPFAQGGQASFYYITPPDPSWPPTEQKAYVPSVHGLLFTTIHEVWPGHFLHSLHMRQVESAALRSFWNYLMGEGWAHYTEELLWESGWSTDPAVRVGQLENALLRNIRFVSALGLHTEGMTLEESAKLFREQAFQDNATAQQQAVRGTFDPMYLAYTVGKLVIMKLRDDVRAKVEAEGGEFSLRAFHDELLSYGTAPLPAIREAMLGADAGPVL